jgi:membrane-anchored glycerophosphoryl diester phosphodiesterase (GDPDase)
VKAAMNNPYTSLTKFLWHFTKRFRRYVIGLFLVGLVWAAYFSINPTMIKLIIDAVSEHQDDLVAHALGPILGFLGCWLF